MKPTEDTLNDGSDDGPGGAPARPGVVWLLINGRVCLRAQPLEDGKLLFGRDNLDDDRVSRRHAEVSVSERGWRVRDLDSRNGTFADAKPVAGAVESESLSLLRIGRSVGLLARDVSRFDGATVQTGEQVIGPTLARALGAVDRAAAAGKNLLLLGESGAGKELAARRFHGAGRRAGGPFVAVNCAAIPHGIAERLLFGAKRGAYSGADADAPGHVQAADGGVLFLDEIGELDLAVQAKLLRLLESKEVLALGSAKPRAVDLSFCFATHRNLRVAVAEGRMRADLYYRVVEPEVLIPPLRERREEIPWLIAGELSRLELRAHPSFLEACLLRPWPGNVRELLAAVRAAADRARSAGSAVVRAGMLGSDDGRGLAPPAAATPSPPPLPKSSRALSAAELQAAVAEAGGNVAAAARALGLHRTQLYRLMARAGVRGRGDD